MPTFYINSNLNYCRLFVVFCFVDIVTGGALSAPNLKRGAGKPIKFQGRSFSSWGRSYSDVCCHCYCYHSREASNDARWNPWVPAKAKAQTSLHCTLQTLDFTFWYFVGIPSSCWQHQLQLCERTHSRVSTCTHTSSSLTYTLVFIFSAYSHPTANRDDTHAT